MKYECLHPFYAIAAAYDENEKSIFCTLKYNSHDFPDSFPEC